MALGREEIDTFIADMWRNAQAGKPVVRPMRANRLRTQDVVPEQVDFLWDGRIARGKFAILDGDPGLGKSTLLLDIAARLSRGGAMPLQIGSREPEGVVLLSGEDGLADTTVPRLVAAEARLEHIEVLNSLLDEEDIPLGISIPEHIPYIEEAVRDLNAGLVVIDPLVAYLGDAVDNYRDSHVRRALAPLVAMAEETGAAIVAVRHPNKGGGKAIHRGGGSIGIIGAARTGLYVARDPEDETSSILAVTKTNIGPQPDAMRFQLVASGPEEFSPRKLLWTAAIGLTAEDLIAMEDANRDTQDALIEAMVFLRQILLYGRVSLDEIRVQAKARGVLEADLKKARRRLHLREFSSAVDRKWCWEMPSTYGEGQGDLPTT